MSTVKITELPLISQISANTANTLFLGVDVPSLTTGKMTVTTLAQGLYSNNILIVGKNTNLLPNTVAQFSLSGDSYIQTNLVNINDGGSADIVVTANTGTDSTYFIDMGYVNKNYQPGMEFNNIGTAVYPLDGYLYAQGLSGTSPGGNLVIGTTTSNTSLKFIVGGGSSSNIVAYMTSNSLVLNTQSFITFSDGSIQNSGVSNAYVQSAYAFANTINTNQSGINTTQNTWISSNAVFTQAAFNLTNTAVQNTATIIIGNLISTGNLTANTTNTTAWFSQVKIQGGQNGLTINNSSFPANTALVRIDASNGYAAQTPTANGYMLQIQGLDNTPTRVAIDSSGVNGTGNAYSLLVGRAARGTAASPTSPQSGDLLFRIAGNGYGTTGYAVQNGGAVIDWIALDNFTDTTKGTQLNVSTTIIGSNTRVLSASFNANTVYFANTVTPANGIINTVRVGSASPLTINFTTDTIVRANLSANFTVTPASFVAGKTIDVWLTNTSSGGGATHTITHGVSALNSSVGTTTFNLTGTQTAMLKYMCADGTLANTFVAITYQ